jgi:hypothetical protein
MSLPSLRSSALLILLACTAANTSAQLEVIPTAAPQVVFAGVASTIEVTIRNRGSVALDSEFSTRLFQVSSATRLPVGGSQVWKRLQILPEQTILESVPVHLPDVRAITQFQVQMLAADKPAGQCTVVGCPRDLIRQLVDITGAKHIAVLDSDRKLRPLLDKAGAASIDLTSPGGDSGAQYALAILGPFARRESVPPDFTTRANDLVKRNIAVVALLPPGTLGGFDSTAPLHMILPPPGGQKPAMVWSETGAEPIENSARAQLALFRLSELALGLRPTAPDFSFNQPP